MTITVKFCMNSFCLQFNEFPEMSVFQHDSAPVHRTRETVIFFFTEKCQISSGQNCDLLSIEFRFSALGDTDPQMIQLHFE